MWPESASLTGRFKNYLLSSFIMLILYWPRWSEGGRGSERENRRGTQVREEERKRVPILWQWQKQTFERHHIINKSNTKWRGKDWLPGRGGIKVEMKVFKGNVRRRQCGAIRCPHFISFLIYLTAMRWRFPTTARSVLPAASIWGRPTSALKIHRSKFFMSRLWSEEAEKKDAGWRLLRLPFVLCFSPSTSHFCRLWKDARKWHFFK